MKDSHNLYIYENEYLSNGYKYIAGCDEAGRGPIAGPVFCAACILDPNNPIEGLNDSKQLSEKERNRLYPLIKERALAYKVILIDEKTIDRINILESSRLGMEEAVLNLSIKPDFILTDYMDLYKVDIPYLKLAHGDALSASIAAASILAKVERDRYMVELDKKYPLYDLKTNKGYPTKAHLEAIDKYGICEIHRKTFKPVQKIINKQLSLDI
ncbi:MAG: ribonuclease HII [Gammaproteobacteria bacterium]|nr:ribonuclease HII [Gammaproteobacteria bacterium]